jgi:hypothetical protein
MGGCEPQAALTPVAYKLTSRCHTGAHALQLGASPVSSDVRTVTAPDQNGRVRSVTSAARSHFPPERAVPRTLS